MRRHRESPLPRHHARGRRRVGLVALGLLLWVAIGCRVRRETDDRGPPASTGQASAASVALPAPAPVPPSSDTPPPPSAKAAPPRASPSAGAPQEPSAPDGAAPEAAAKGGEAAPRAPEAPEPPRLPPLAAVVAHGGVGSAPGDSSVVLGAVHRALEAIARGQSALDAVALGTAVLEDAPGFDAGTGSSVRLDGSIQMDARVMDSTGRYGVVLGIERIKNPVLAAAWVSGLDTPSLVGEGATAFARERGATDYDPGTASARARRQRALRALGIDPETSRPTWKTLEGLGAGSGVDAGASAADRVGPSPGSVALLLRLSRDHFAGAVSDGGTLTSLRGHVGSVAAAGAALYVGTDGAVAVSGDAPTVITEALARAVYERMKRAGSPKAAAAWGLDQVGAGEAVGISAMNSMFVHSTATAPMAWATWSRGDVRTGALAEP